MKLGNKKGGGGQDVETKEWEKDKILKKLSTGYLSI